MKIINNHKSPNFTDTIIPVEFVILHYTGCDLETTLKIFKDPQTKVTSHFVIDTNGDCYDLGGFVAGPILKAAHAGKSHFTINSQRYESFNDFSIGIELVNLNGNIFKFTDEQYETLSHLVGMLQERFPQLKNSERIIGHEHIAYWRGKADPGLKFDWYRFFKYLSLTPKEFHFFHICKNEDVLFIKAKIAEQKMVDSGDQKDLKLFWPQLSTELEKRIAEREANSNAN